MPPAPFSMHQHLLCHSVPLGATLNSRSTAREGLALFCLFITKPREKRLLVLLMNSSSAAAVRDRFDQFSLSITNLQQAVRREIASVSSFNTYLQHALTEMIVLSILLVRLRPNKGPLRAALIAIT